MQDTILTILEKAPDWMTAGDIAEKGGYRSAGNVGVCLKNLGDRVVSRKSPIRKSLNGMPQVEWRHADKQFGEDDLPVAAVKALEKNGTSMPEKSVVKDSLTTDMPTDKACCNAAKVVATTAGGVVAELQKRCTDQESRISSMQDELDDRKSVIDAINDDIRRQIQRAESAEQNRDDLKMALDQANRANDGWMALAGEYECKSIPELRVFIGALIDRVESLKAMPSSSVTAKGFVVRTPNKPPRYTSKHATAHSAAMSAARQHGMAEVFALVPVGKAVRGAEWRDSQ